MRGVVCGDVFVRSLLVAMPGSPSSFVFLAVRPGAPSSGLVASLLLVSMPFVQFLVVFCMDMRHDGCRTSMRHETKGFNGNCISMSAFFSLDLHAPSTTQLVVVFSLLQGSSSLYSYC